MLRRHTKACVTMDCLGSPLLREGRHGDFDDSDCGHARRARRSPSRPDGGMRPCSDVGAVVPGDSRRVFFAKVRLHAILHHISKRTVEGLDRGRLVWHVLIERAQSAPLFLFAPYHVRCASYQRGRQMEWTRPRTLSPIIKPLGIESRCRTTHRRRTSII